MIEDRKIHTSDKNKIIAAVRIDAERFGELRSILDDNYTLCDLADEEEALALLGRSLEQVLAVLFDADMEEEADFGLLGRIDADKRFVEIPVIAVSDGSRDDLRTRCIAAGVNEFFEPPFRREMIPIRVKNAARAKDGMTFREIENMLCELPSNIFLKDVNGNYVFVTHYWHHLNEAGEPGWTIRRKSDLDIRKDTENAIRAMEADKEIIRTGKGTSYIIEENDEGVQEFLQLIKSPTYDEAGNINGIIAIINDVTEREQFRRRLEDRTEAIEAELRIAAQIQDNMLPVAFKGHKNISVSAAMTPAKEVGGDFYDYFFIDDDHVGLVMADVSGKGVPAALFMAISKIVIHDRALVGGPPAEILRDANDRISSTNKMGLFVTVWFGILDLNTGIVTYTNAGHEYPAVRHGKNGEYEILETENFPPVATMEGIDYENSTLTLEDGDSLFLYTDGVADVKDPSGEHLGLDRLAALLKSAVGKNTAETVQFVNDAVNDFLAGTDRFDDTTMMCVTYHKS